MAETSNIVAFRNAKNTHVAEDGTVFTSHVEKWDYEMRLKLINTLAGFWHGYGVKGSMHDELMAVCVENSGFLGKLLRSINNPQELRK